MYYLDDEDDDSCCLDEEIPKPDMVRNGLFISGYETSENRELLKRVNITHVIDLRGGKELFPKDFKYLILPNVSDIPDQDILSHFPKCIEFINEGIKVGGVLIHCVAGVSRSATVVCAYLMQTEKLTVNQAIEELRSARSCICPNPGFRWQLHLWGEMNFNLEGKTKAHRIYNSMKIVSEYEYHGFRTTCWSLAEDPLEFDVDEYYACRTCYRKLFTDANLIDHSILSFKSTIRCSFSQHNGAKCDSFFVEPLSWMNLEEFDQTHNKLRLCRGSKVPFDLKCPNMDCGLILGWWTQAPSQCSCSAAIKPAFVIKKHQVLRLSPDSNDLSTGDGPIRQSTMESTCCTTMLQLNSR